MLITVGFLIEVNLSFVIGRTSVILNPRDVMYINDEGRQLQRGIIH